MSLPVVLIAVFLSFLPIFFWVIILSRKHRKNMLFFFLVAFVLSMGFSALFQHVLEGRLEGVLLAESISSLRFLGSYILLGMLIEYGKNFIVRLTGGKYFKTIDDVMDLSFATALGFTVYRNAFIFSLLLSGGIPDVIGPVKILKEILKNIFFVLPIHLFCSGIFGYFYGLSLFANEELKESHREQSARYRMVSFKTLKILKGTAISTIFYGIFFTILKLDPTIGDITEFFGFGRLIILGTEIDEKIMPLFSFLFFSLGTVFLFQFLDQKREYSQQNLLIDKNTNTTS